jgi:nucleoside-diphosphate-sugar epimerase
MRTIVTGAAGFLGYYIADQLSRDPEVFVTCVDNMSRGVADSHYLNLYERPNVARLDIDLTDPVQVAQLPLDADVIFHMAALNGTQNFYEKPFEVVRSCTLPTLFIIEHLGRNGVKPRFIFAGTSEVYAAAVTRFNWPVPTNEEVPLCIDDAYNPRWSYGASKLHGEVVTINGCGNFQIPFTIVRYHNAYGPRMGDKHVIPDFLERAKLNVFELYGGVETRSFLYADDAATATIALSVHPNSIGETIHLGGEREVTMTELAQLIMNECGMEGELVVHPAPPGSVARRCPDTKKARNILGEFEKISLEEGLRRTAGFYLPI